MSLLRNNIVSDILNNYRPKLQDCFSAFSPVNIALCKYWGKRNKELNLPINDSLSISMGDKGTHTTIQCLNHDEQDTLLLNDQKVTEQTAFYQKAIGHIDLFRQVFGPQPFFIKTKNTIATGAGLASSASGFAALTRSIAGIYGLDLSERELSILSRLGSGSACRSIFTGFVHWHAGKTVDGNDCYASPIEDQWPELRVGILTVCSAKKSISSREGMSRTVDSSPLYKAWPEKARIDIRELKQAIAKKDFASFGQTAEHNSLSMHATMLSSWPPIFYWMPETIALIQKVWELRREGIPIYFTMDAGPNIKLLFLEKHTIAVNEFFTGIEVITPFISEASL